MARVRHVDGTTDVPLHDGWECASTAAGAIDHPDALSGAAVQWRGAQVPGTMASALAAAGAWDSRRTRDFDGEDWWLRCTLTEAVAAADRGRAALRFGGLATLADAWLDGTHVLRSENMFLEHEVELGEAPTAGRTLVLRFAALPKAARRPRPRWRATIVGRQDLRWVRTALFGRMPSFPPTAAAVGAYRPITLRRVSRLEASGRMQTRIEGADGTAAVHLRLRPVDGSRVEHVSFDLGEVSHELSVQELPDGELIAHGTLCVPRVRPWFPHTHGRPHLLPARATVSTGAGAIRIDLGAVGFRRLEVDRDDDGFGLRVNGVDVFCRGAAWMPLDALCMSAPDEAYRGALRSVVDAGMNMVRVSGVTAYEADAFYETCDELGVMVWQDFMFANMDYPEQDAAFRESVEREASQFLDRVEASPSIAVLCGNSEIGQQRAMLGIPFQRADGALFSDVLAAAAAAQRPDVPYVETTPFGGTPCFRCDSGVSHYYGVGAYLRPLDDARRADVRFTSECLAFSNVPADATIDAYLRDGERPTTSPAWKAGVPRDRGRSWDFEDVRDHYLRLLFGKDPAELRRADVGRYLELSRVASGLAMAGAMTEWRRSGSRCRGALVWTLRDTVPGAGWGLVDSTGRPKAAYYFLKRLFSPVALMMTDEGLNGLTVHAVNETDACVEGRLRIALYRHGETRVAEESRRVSLPARTVTAIPDASVLGRFTDSTYAYRFGPASHDTVVATLHGAADGVLAQSFHFPVGFPTEPFPDPGLEASAERMERDAWRVRVVAPRLAFATAFDCRGFVPDDDYFHLEPGVERFVTLRGPDDLAGVQLKALNAEHPAKVAVVSAPRQASPRHDTVRVDTAMPSRPPTID